jgi:hypothetical protein
VLSPELLPRDYVQPAGWKAVLIAGDDAEPAFDNAVEAMAEKLVTFGVNRANVTVLKTDSTGAQAATRENIENAFEKLKTGPRDGCFVFATSHGMPERGLVLKRARTYLSPAMLAGLIELGCADRPSVAIVSGCFSGGFAESPAMRAKTRVILTASRRDRPSFGCNANLRYTFFDRCVLDNLIRGVAWPVVMNKARECVAAEERRLGDARSEPQMYVGAATEDLRVFSR